MDEIEILTVQKPEKILDSKCQKQMGCLTIWERDKIRTVICVVSASGSCVPPMFMFSLKAMSPFLERGHQQISFKVR